MRNSLLLRLMGAFALVIAIGTAGFALVTSQTTRDAFALYTTRSGLAWAQRVAPDLAAYYAAQGNWQGVEGLLAEASGSAMTGAMNGGEMNGGAMNGSSSGGGMMGHGYGRGMGGSGQGQGQGQGQGLGAGGMMASMGQRWVLADAQGQVISDSQGDLVGQTLSAQQMASGAAVQVDGQTVGVLLVTLSDVTGTDTLAGQFFQSVNRALWISAAAAAGLALLLGGLLFRQITAPLRGLKQAAAAIARGDWSQRAPLNAPDELGQVSLAFNQMADSLAHAEEQRRQFLADVAHELRTPLAAMQGTLEAMQDGVLPLEDEQLAALHAETLLLNRLVSDLRLLSLAEAGQLTLERQPADPADLVQRAVEAMRPLAAQKDIRLLVDADAGLPQVSVDVDRMAQVFNNLLANALRYTPQGGQVTVQVHQTRTSGLTTSADQAVQFSITDNGPGIAAQDLPYVFDRFYRADKSRARVSGGSGLGLAIVRQLVAAHGGSVRAESAGVRAESAGVRAESAGVRAESAGVRAESAGVRAESAGVRAESAGVSAENAGVSAEPPGLNAQSPGVNAEGFGEEQNRQAGDGSGGSADKNFGGGADRNLGGGAEKILGGGARMIVTLPVSEA